MMLRNERGLTLIEVLVSVAVLAAGSVYAMQAIAKGAEAQRQVEVRNAAYLLMAEHLAQAELRVSPVKDPLKETQGFVKGGTFDLRWTLTPSFSAAGPFVDPQGPRPPSYLLDKTFTAVWSHGSLRGSSSWTMLGYVPPLEEEAV